MTVFRVLFPHWTSFCDFRKSQSPDNRDIISSLQKQRRIKMEKMRKLAKEQEEALQKVCFAKK